MRYGGNLVSDEGHTSATKIPRAESVLLRSASDVSVFPAVATATSMVIPKIAASQEILVPCPRLHDDRYMGRYGSTMKGG